MGTECRIEDDSTWRLYKYSYARHKPVISILALVTYLVHLEMGYVQNISATKILPESGILLDPKKRLDKLNLGETESNQVVPSIFWFFALMRN